MPGQSKSLTEYKCKDLSQEQIQSQLNLFKKGVTPLKLARPASINDGIIQLSSAEEAELADSFVSLLADKKPVKFVPASGAASRMFKTLQQYYLPEKQRDTTKEAKSASSERQYLNLFFQGLKLQKFAFYRDVKTHMLRNNIDLGTLIDRGEFAAIVSTMLDPAGLNFQLLPKALLEFHRYGDSARNALEEHLFEAMAYARDKNGRAHLHFTMSAEAQVLARNYLEGVLEKFRKQGLHFSINFSEQEGWTNTIAVDDKNEPIKDMEDTIITRPGGHGALIENLNVIDADIIFIKNIDNVAHENHTGDTLKYKRILGSYLLKIQQKIFTYLSQLKQPEIESGILAEISSFAASKLFLPLPEPSPPKPPQPIKEQLFNLLNRPVRVCGMVKNQGDPGGAPFWIRDECNNETMQIVESVQISPPSLEQQKILKQSTHFNPVDIVVGMKDFQGNKFDLRRFIDHDQYMISEKFMLGKNVRVLEHPGLWNGAMANWITIFIEVPLTTFNPVKTVNDLLKPLHQP